ncbi:Gfo/Idh/MocA family oxidoreductase [Deinococcus sp. KSM4-11]|uniref:Gfo/Idh/MocA family protein n=1 Tax=Deinococcus sp. KSM4-11 TaxID=2568654 RepID=UPI0010A32144|nr:Gfo/Idh/MocA family oxidoreductase [Deinococcus sp. KSM4-11]THF86083.1 Gfo/Idh/MocA family oxidoreductase [Deinococcus sp. KSM4-11]
MRRVGLIGAGLMGTVHAQAWAQRPGVLDAVYAPDDRARGFAARQGLTPYATLDDFWSAVDVVDLCTPTPTHAEYAVQAARAGKHVICEKPLARTLEEADRVIAACREGGVRLFVAHVLRFFPQYRLAWQQVQAGAVGEPRVLRLGRMSSPPTAGSWLLDEAQSGGVPLDLLIHDLDYARWIAGNVRSVSAVQARREGRVTVHATLSHVSGAITLVEGGWAAPPGVFRTHLDIAGTAGVIEWTSDAPTPWQAHGAVSVTPEQDGAALPELGADDPYAAELWHAYDALDSGAPFLIEPQDARASLALALAVIRSSESGQPVVVEA